MASSVLRGKALFAFLLESKSFSAYVADPGKQRGDTEALPSSPPHGSTHEGRNPEGGRSQGRSLVALDFRPWRLAKLGLGNDLRAMLQAEKKAAHKRHGPGHAGLHHHGHLERMAHCDPRGPTGGFARGPTGLNMRRHRSQENSCSSGTRKAMPLSDASIGNLERLSKFVDAGYIKEHIMANKPIDDKFESHMERMANLLSSGMFTAKDYREQLDAKVADLLRDGAPRSAAADGEAGVGGSQVGETPRAAQKKGKRTAKEARAAANTMHGNIVNCWAAATNKPVSWLEIPFACFGYVRE
ncbi:unnamed protein product [Ectocarpus sp. CCAP 1310/34]|nr:unnamed protein product [Ectocarpus sp. CCAP 1310/34]